MPPNKWLASMLFPMRVWVPNTNGVLGQAQNVGSYCHNCFSLACRPPIPLPDPQSERHNAILINFRHRNVMHQTLII